MDQISKLVKDIIPVIIGILIALLINNWNEDRKEKKYLKQIFTSINNELEENRIDIKESIPKQQILIDTIGKYINDETVAIIDIIKKTDGIHGPNIQNNSWKAISNTKIELIEFEKLSKLSEIDDTNENLKYKKQKLIDFVVDNLKNTDSEKKEIFMLLNQEILSSGKYLQSEIEKFLKN